ncbi:MAG TPA: CHAD domain-containing protein [Steroidobacter sp.]|jgi:CHAD domain-containing protein|nr:CHAD domain-containing protein [Steroidobacter sp.]
MPTALKQGEPAMRGARRVLFDHIDRAIRTLQRHSLADEPVHEARKEMKRTRAGLRLLREALGEPAYRRLNRSVRDAARPLTPIRDAKVLHDALEDVLQQAGKSAQDCPRELRQVLQQERRLSREKLSDKDLKAIGTRLGEVKRYLQSLPESRLDHAHTDAALKQAYKKAHKALALANREPSNEHLHEWRKQVKYHFQQLEFVQPLKPKLIGATIKQAHQLSDRLGEDHDLALLHEKIALHATEAQSSSDTAASDALIKELKRLRAKLQRKSYRLGKKLYADKPKRVAKQVGKYVDAWRSQAT